MTKLYTEVRTERRSDISITLSNRIVMLGSCFSDEIGGKLRDAGFQVLCNPFGTLYNPASIASAVSRLDGDTLFTVEDCVQMGAGAERICSFEHHSSFAALTSEDFLEKANSSLVRSRDFWHNSDIVIITLGTSFIWKHKGKVVSNCLKRPAREFDRSMLSFSETAALLSGIVRNHPEKRFIFTVSPIRHLGDGAHANTISKSSLHIGLQSVLEAFPQRTRYVPAYEILLDELRDYRFYANDLVHPRDISVDIIWNRLKEFCIPENEYRRLEANLKASAASQHIPNTGK